MAEFLFIRPAPAAALSPAHVEWVPVDETGALLAAPASGVLADVKPVADGKRVVFLAPAAEVMLTRVVLPSASPARMRQMLPFSLEDSLADDVDDLAFAVGTRDGAAVAAAVVAKDRLEAWLAGLASAEIAPAAVCSEAEGVPDSAGTVTIVLEGSRALCRRAGEPPLAFEGLDLASVLELVLPSPEPTGDEDQTEESAKPEAAAAPVDKVIVYFDEAARAQHAHDLARLDELGPQAEQRFMADGTLPHLAAVLAQRPGTNLLQGAYSPKSNWTALARPWQLAASLAGVALLLAVLLQVASYVSLRREDAALTAAVSTGCQRLVGTDRLAACRAEVQNRLRSVEGSGGQGSFLPMLAAVAESLEPAMQLSMLNFRSGVLTLEVPSSSVDALERFTTAVGESGRFTARLDQFTTETSRLQVTER